MRLIIHKLISFILLVLLAPILAISIFLLKLENPSLSPFFKQERVGAYGRLFKMYKLRTMRPISKEESDSLAQKNEAGAVIFKIKNDPRITPVGNWLRKLSIDEFPQLINVLKGEMALVGPRPPLVKEVVQYNVTQCHRLDTLPGCTGLWQISGRSDLDFEEMVQLDLLYLQKQTLAFDLLIIGKTIFTVVTMRGAY